MPGRVLPMTLADAKLIWGPICQTFPLNFKFKKQECHAVSRKHSSHSQGYNYSGGDATCSLISTLADAVYLMQLTFISLFAPLSF